MVQNASFVPENRQDKRHERQKIVAFYLLKSLYSL
jgi:hypothetical protein